MSMNTEKVYYVCDLSQYLPGGYTHLPVFKFLAIDAHSSLIALGNTHLVPAALNLLTGVLGGVYICEKIENELLYILTALTFTLLFPCPSLYFSLSQRT